MTFKPAHKEDRPEHMPGQIRNDVSLGDYIARKQRQDAFDAVAAEKKMSFNTWWELNYKNLSMQYDDFAFCWDAAQKNK